MKAGPTAKSVFRSPRAIYLPVGAFAAMSLYAAITPWLPSLAGSASVIEKPVTVERISDSAADLHLTSLAGQPLFNANRKPQSSSPDENGWQADGNLQIKEGDYQLIGLVTRDQKAVALLRGLLDEEIVLLRQGNHLGGLTVDRVEAAHLFLSNADGMHEVQLGDSISVLK